MSRRTSMTVVGAVLLAANSLALASDGPRTTAATGTFSASPVNARTRTCVGEDGPYLEISGKFAGTINSSDARLTGTLEFVAHALVNLSPTNGLGTFEGTFQVRELNGGRQTAHGLFNTVVTESSLNHGFARGKVKGAGPGEGSEDFFARFESVVDGALNVTGSFGGAADQRAPAVIQSGHCSGPWTRVP